MHAAQTSIWQIFSGNWAGNLQGHGPGDDQLKGVAH
jgi:hypothetical protein